MISERKALIYASLAILCWSTVASAFKISLRHLDPLNLLLFSSAISTLTLFVLLMTQKKWQTLRRLRVIELRNAAIRGFLNPFLYYIVLFKAYTLLKAQEAGTLNYIWPITLVLLSVPFLKQRISPWSMVAIAVSFLGIVIISTEGRISALEFREPVGVLLALGSSLFWSFYWILNVKDQQDEIVKLFLNFATGTILVLVAVLMLSEPVWPSFEGIAGAAYIGLFEMSLAFFFWLKALKLAENTARISNLVYISPFISLLIIRLSIGERILVSTVVGLSLIVLGIVIQQFIHLKKKV
ncbi:MAG: DMT family transporter [Bacteroidales bacterium]